MISGDRNMKPSLFSKLPAKVDNILRSIHCADCEYAFLNNHSRAKGGDSSLKLSGVLHEIHDRFDRR